MDPDKKLLSNPIEDLILKIMMNSQNGLQMIKKNITSKKHPLLNNNITHRSPD